MAESEALACLRRRIEAEGPLSLADCMRFCLADERYGYYRRESLPFGAHGDFVTAPSLTSLFGQTIGLWLVDRRRRLRDRRSVILAELGPGDGSLIVDALGVAERAAPGFAAATPLHLVEISAPLRRLQGERLAAIGVRPVHHDDAESLAAAAAGSALMVAANEFLDALPIRQAQWDGDGWRERCVGLDDEGELTFVAVSRPGKEDPSSWLRLEGLPPPAPGDIRETSAQREAVVACLAARMAEDGGVGLFIDYGYAEPAYGDSFQAVRAHRAQSPLRDIGAADVTAHVDFAAAASAAADAGCRVEPIQRQGPWLRSLGIEALCARACRAAPQRSVAAALEVACRRLIAMDSPRDMGRLFKVLIFHGEEGRGDEGRA